MWVRIIQALVAVSLMTSASAAFAQSTRLEVKAASELPAWKTITIGLHRGVNAFRNALDDARIAVGDAADEILGRPAFAFAREHKQLDLVLLSVAALGFGQGGKLAAVLARPARPGFELCPEEVGPQWRR